MLSPRKPLDEDNLAETYQTYKKWQQKRQVVKERMKERLNESLSPFKSNAPSTTESLSKSGLLKRDASTNAAKKTPSIKERIQEIATGLSGKTLDISSASGKSKGGDETGKRRFDDLLNNYFSTLSTTVSSPVKSHSTKKLQTALDQIKAGFQKRPSGEAQPVAVAAEFMKPSKVREMYKTAYTIEAQQKPSIPLLLETSYKTVSKSFIPAVSTIVQYPQSARNAAKQLLKDELKRLQTHVEKMTADEYAALPIAYQDELLKLAQTILFKQKMSKMTLKTSQTLY